MPLYLMNFMYAYVIDRTFAEVVTKWNAAQSIYQVSVCSIGGTS